MREGWGDGVGFPSLPNWLSSAQPLQWHFQGRGKRLFFSSPACRLPGWAAAIPPASTHNATTSFPGVPSNNSSSPTQLPYLPSHYQRGSSGRAYSGSSSPIWSTATLLPLLGPAVTAGGSSYCAMTSKVVMETWLAVSMVMCKHRKFSLITNFRCFFQPGRLPLFAVKLLSI